MQNQYVLLIKDEYKLYSYMLFSIILQSIQRIYWTIVVSAVLFLRINNNCLSNFRCIIIFVDVNVSTNMMMHLKTCYDSHRIITHMWYTRRSQPTICRDISFTPQIEHVSSRQDKLIIERSWWVLGSGCWSFAWHHFCWSEQPTQTFF